MNRDTVADRYYGKTGSAEDSAIVQKRIHWMVKQCSGDRVLDIGCSQGIASVLLAREGFEVVGLDIEADAIKFAKESLRQENPVIQQRVQFEVIGQTSELANKYGHFSSVLCGEVLEHLAHPKRFLADVSECLQTNGKLIVTVPFGIHPFYDHKQSFVFTNFLPFFSGLFSIESVDLISNYIFAVFRKIGAPETHQPENGCNYEKLLSAVEEAFKENQQTRIAREELFRARIERLEGRLDSLLRKTGAAADSKLASFIMTLRSCVDRLAAIERCFLGLSDATIHPQQQSNGDKSGECASEAVRVVKDSEVARELVRAQNALADIMSSFKYQVVDLVVTAIKRPGWKAIRLPYDLMKMTIQELVTKDAKDVRKEKLGFQSKRVSIDKRIPTQEVLKIDGASSNAILFVPINGVGLGHLTRCLAISKSLERILPSKQMLFFTTSLALPILDQSGYYAYHFPSKTRYDRIAPGREWNALLENYLLEVLRFHRPQAIIFDGAKPYRGISNVMDRVEGVQKIWIKRGLYRSSKIAQDLDGYFQKFDVTIVPGEYGVVDEGQVMMNNVFSVPPIILTDKSNELSRESACQVMDISDTTKNIYVQLGAGNINDICELTSAIIETLNSISGVSVVWGESPIARSEYRPRGSYRTLRDYPNSKYFAGFDLAILASGYNSVHEAIFFGLPAIFFPNGQTASDDQIARARLAETTGFCDTMLEFDAEVFRQKVLRLLALNKAVVPKGYPGFENGAVKSAEYIASVLTGWDLRPVTENTTARVSC